ncbi:DUF5677 domain-containing protein [Winogradskyella sp. Asnod2-B02-A]|uniref:DUF5677 domain-containing protein n=1 Tax=Winogradskyella sp. Asnod2-B02-A TaxID=3160583 RepID=UPI00386B78AD
MKEQPNVISDFELLTEIGCDLSQHFRGIYVDDEIKTKSTHLLAKAIDNSFSILKLIPDSKYSDDKENYLDISSVFSLCRNLIELSNIFWYLIDDNIEQNEFEFRIDILNYHDYISTDLIFNRIFYDEKNVEYLENKISEFKDKIENNPHFEKLDKQTKKFILNGKKSTLLTQFEIVKKRDLDLEEFRAYYKLMSVHTHSSPTSVTQLVFTQGMETDGEFNNLMLSFLIMYCGSFLANLIKSTTELWEMKFAKTESEKIINEYVSIQKL